MPSVQDPEQGQEQKAMKRYAPGERPFSTFVRRYMEGYVSGESGAQIAKRLGTTEAAMLVYASDLRRIGVKVPRLNDRVDVAFLNRIIRKAVK
jgi:hypothetical protein